MVALPIALLAGLLLSSAARSDGVATQVADFQSAVEEKRYDEAQAQVRPLAVKFGELGVVLADKTTAKEVVVASQADRKLISDGFAKAIGNVRAPTALHAVILREFGPKPEEGEKLLLKALELKHIEDAPEVLAAGVKALGSYRKTKHLDTLAKYARSSKVDVVNAAASALGGYFGEKESIRKQIAGDLVLAYTSAGSGIGNFGTEGGGTRTLVDSAFRMSVCHEFKLALERLTGGTSFNSAEEWAEWYRANKAKPWRDGVDSPKGALQSGGVCPVPSGH